MPRAVPSVNYARLTSAVFIGIGTPRTMSVSYCVGAKAGAVTRDYPAWCLSGSGAVTVSGPGTTSVDAGLNALAQAIVTAEGLGAGDQILNTDAAVLLQL